MDLEKRVALLEDHISELYGLLDMPLREKLVERQFEERMEWMRQIKKEKAETPVKESRPFTVWHDPNGRCANKDCTYEYGGGKYNCEYEI